MAREVFTKIWCDPCLHTKDIKIEANEMPPVTVGQKSPRVMALCPECEAGFFAPFIEGLEAFGDTPDSLEKGKARGRVDKAAAPATGKRIPCPLECGTKPLKNISSVSSHLRSMHDTNLYGVLGESGILYDVDGAAIDVGEIRNRQTAAPAITRAECQEPDCTKVYTYPENKMPIQALGVHMAKTHKKKLTEEQRVA